MSGKSDRNGNSIELGRMSSNGLVQADQNPNGPFTTTTINLQNPEEESRIGLLNHESNNNTFREEEVPVRETYANRMEFLLSCISMSVGLANVWRFPATAYNNGGGCFLIVYFIVLALVGRPIYFLELVLGQFSSYGPIKIWRIVPALKGIGYAQMMVATCIASFYVCIMGITVMFFLFSFQNPLPWSQCDANNTQSSFTVPNATLSFIDVSNGTLSSDDFSNETLPLDTFPNETLSCDTFSNETLSKLSVFYTNEILQEKASIVDGIGLPEWRLTLCLLFSWVIIFAVLFKGVKSSGKWAYFTSLFPYFVLIVLLIRGVTLEGAWTGIYYFFVPQWDKLYDIKIWYAAVSQVFLSLGSGIGIITMLSSYNKFNRNIYKDAMIISLVDTFTSLLAGITVFAILGHLADKSGVGIDKVVKKGPGLAFAAIPYVISKFPWLPQLFSVLFFLMVFIVGLGSASALVNTIITAIADEFQGLKRWLLVGSACIVGFLFGLIYTTPGGQYMVTLVDFFGVNFLLYVTATLEIIAVAWFYGIENIRKDVEFMLNRKLGLYWTVCWKYVAPISLAFILSYALITETTLEHNGQKFPTSATVSGIILSIFCLMWIPLWAIYMIYKRPGDTLKEKIRAAFRPADSWGPRDPQKKKEWELMKNE